VKPEGRSADKEESTLLIPSAASKKKKETRSSPHADHHSSAYQRSGDDIITIFLNDATREEAALNRAAGVMNACVRVVVGEGGGGVSSHSRKTGERVHYPASTLPPR